MKRLLAISTIGFILSSMLCISADSKTVTICLSVLTAVFTLSFISTVIFRNHTCFYFTIILGFMLLSFVLFRFYHLPKVENARSYDGYNGKITAQITEIYTNDYYSELKVNNVKIDKDTISTHILVSLPESIYDYKEGDYIVLDGELHTEFLSFFNSDEEKYLASQDIFLLMDADSIKKSEIKPNLFRNFIFDYRTKSIAETETLEHGGFVSALALGDKSNLNAETQADFQKLGLQHALAVSGMHLSLLVMSLYVLLQRFSVGKYPLSVICSLLTVFYMALTGFTFSIVRAGIMMIIYFISLLVRRSNDSITTLFASALFILIDNPWSVSDVGFQLSFFSTLGILVFAKPLIERIEEHSFFHKKLPKERIPRFIVKLLKKSVKSFFASFCVSISATLTTLPLMLLYFNSITPLSIVANVTVIFLINIVLVVSVAYIILVPILIAPLEIAGQFICDTLCRETLSLTGILADILPNPLYFSPETSEIVATVCGFILLFFFLFYKNHKTAIYATISFIIAITLTLGAVNIINRKTSYITFSTSPTCCDTLIETTSGKTLLSYVKKDFSITSMYRIIKYRKAYSLDTVIIFVDGASVVEKVKAILEEAEINRLILVQINGGLSSKDRTQLSEIVDFELVKSKEFTLDETVSFIKYGKSYITVSVKQGDNDTAIVYTLNGKSSPPSSRIEDVESVVLLGAVESCPRYDGKQFYLCSLPEKLIKRKCTSNSDKFNFGFIKLSDKTIKYNIY